MSQMDRLTTLMERFTLEVKPASLAAATMVVTGREGGAPGVVWFGRAGVRADLDPDTVLFAAAVEWGGVSNPLLSALPDRICFDLSADGGPFSLVPLVRPTCPRAPRR